MTKPPQAPTPETLTLLGCSLMGPRVGPPHGRQAPLQSTSGAAYSHPASTFLR